MVVRLPVMDATVVGSEGSGLAMDPVGTQRRTGGEVDAQTAVGVAVYLSGNNSNREVSVSFMNDGKTSVCLIDAEGRRVVEGDGDLRERVLLLLRPTAT